MASFAFDARTCAGRGGGELREGAVTEGGGGCWHVVAQHVQSLLSFLCSFLSFICSRCSAFLVAELSIAELFIAELFIAGHLVPRSQNYLGQPQMLPESS
eukprot:349917-Chlamydomonas_euryale.AAC.1